ncbi:MAG TPA: glycosyl hydrolase family 79 C-terminal domain-containing protein [Gemmatimonadales bacterium]|nr:glycosyl hydrolase family 79 C-terminal domain-containing protein [Gemmatimonadales bacterium]
MPAVTLAALALVGCGEGPTAPGAPPVGTPVAADLSVATGAIAPAIPGDFLGLGFETGVWQDPTLTDNPAVQRLITNLGPGSFRFGGNSVEHTYWAMAGPPPEPGGRVLAAQDLARVVALARRVGWRIIVDLNQRVFDPVAAGRAAAAIAPIAGDRLLAFEIGNEPNLYPLNGNRAPTWSVDSDRVEFAAYVQEIRAQVPNAPIAGPATWHADGGAWFTAFLGDRSIPLALATDHFYPTGVPAPSSSVEFATLDNLLSPALMARTASHMATVAAAAQARGLPLRVDESNSSYGFGKPGVSNVHGSALWGLDHLWTLADHGVAGINVKSDSDLDGGLTCAGIYLVFCATSATAIVARPLYYALLAFKAAALGRPVTATLSTSANAAAHAALDDAGTLRVTVINKDAVHPLALSVAAGGATAAQVQLLEGQGLMATGGTSFAGAQVASDGTWSPGPPATVAVAGRKVSVQVPPAGAAVLVLEGFGFER